MPEIKTGVPVEPVREFGPTMIATLTESPKGTLKKTIDIQDHKKNDWVGPDNWNLFLDGTPR
eukprot:2347155-Alexandrium_andersonii.AAC.1